MPGLDTHAAFVRMAVICPRRPRWRLYLCYDFIVKNQIVRLSATDAARDFSRLLDQVEAGGEAIIERRSKPVAIIGPASSAPRRISECIAVPLGRPSAVADPGFADDIARIIKGHPAAAPPSWE